MAECYIALTVLGSRGFVFPERLPNTKGILLRTTHQQQVAVIDEVITKLARANNDNRLLPSFKKLDHSTLSLAPLAKKLLAY